MSLKCDKPLKQQKSCCQVQTKFTKCQNCGNLILTESILSGNTLNAELYSDDKVISKMLTEFPSLTECRQCKKFYG